MNLKKKNDVIGIIVIIIGIIVLIGFVASFLIMEEKKITLHPETLCPTSGLIEKTVVIIDRTDPLTSFQNQELKVYLHDIKNGIPIHSAISIYGMDKSTCAILEPEIFLCNPGRGKDKSPLLANPKLIEKIWEEKFSKRLDDVISRMMEPQTVGNSPIMEKIKAISVTEFIGNDNKNIKKNLIIVSDLMQNTSIYSHYKNFSFDFSLFKKSNAFQYLQCDLTDVDVEILYVRRPDLVNVQGKKHILFWQSFIYEMKGTLVKVKSIN